jgi:hypothetical protein
MKPFINPTIFPAEMLAFYFVKICLVVGVISGYCLRKRRYDE